MHNRLAPVRQVLRETLWILAGMAWLLSAQAAAPADGDTGPSRKAALAVDGISASAGEDEPRVLYILPWQSPSLPRRPRAELNDEVPQLIEPVDPLSLERHRVFRKRLDPLILNPDGNSAPITQ